MRVPVVSVALMTHPSGPFTALCPQEYRSACSCTHATEVTPMGRVAVVTGASRGIGAATAVALAERAFRVVVNYRSTAAEADEVVAAATAAGGEAIAIRADVTEPGDVAAMVGETTERW